MNFIEKEQINLSVIKKIARKLNEKLIGKKLPSDYDLNGLVEFIFFTHSNRDSQYVLWDYKIIKNNQDKGENYYYDNVFKESDKLFKCWVILKGAEIIFKFHQNK